MDNDSLEDSYSVSEWQPNSLDSFSCSDTTESLSKYEVLILQVLQDNEAEKQKWFRRLGIVKNAADPSDGEESSDGDQCKCDTCVRGIGVPGGVQCRGYQTSTVPILTGEKLSTCDNRHVVKLRLRRKSSRLSTFSGASGSAGTSDSVGSRLSDALVLIKLCSKLSLKRFNGRNWATLKEVLDHLDEDTLNELADDFSDLNNITGWWFLDLHQQPVRRERLLSFLRDWVVQERSRKCPDFYYRPYASMLMTYMRSHQLTEVWLDGAFKQDRSIPVEIFLCESVKLLSLRENQLESVPPSVGRLKLLEHLLLTANRLDLRSLPRTLVFCTRLRRLTLDHNLLDALPGFLLQMPALETVHRHGNHNYFKSTFMWYHTPPYHTPPYHTPPYHTGLKCTDRIISCPGLLQDLEPTEPTSFKFQAAQAVIGSRVDFFNSPRVPNLMKDYLCSIFSCFKVCDCCGTALPIGRPGYRVITFKSPWLGNSCVPFEHWACCRPCAVAIEHPARVEQVQSVERQDLAYKRYIKKCAGTLETRVESTTGCFPLSSRKQKCIIM